jgi:hypothetical protein
MPGISIAPRIFAKKGRSPPAPSRCNQNEAIDYPDMMSYVMQDIGGGVPGSHHCMRATDYFLKYMFQEGGQRIGRPPRAGTRLRAEPRPIDRNDAKF